VQAESEASRACVDMAEVHLVTAAEGHYEVGEIRRMRGDLAGAEAAYRQAHLLGRQPEPGLSLLRLAQGRIEDAQASVQAAIAGQSEHLSRARLRVAQVEIAMAAADLDGARQAATDIAEVAAAFGSPGLQAAGEHARGAVLLADGDPTATSMLEAACRHWLELGATYDAARTRVVLAQAHLALGNADRAGMELQAARAVFTELGAEPELSRVEALLGRATRPAGLTERELPVLRMVAAGLSNRRIATTLVLSERTVHRHLSNIFIKLGVSSRAAATAYAYQNRLVSPDRG
jgi:DNA-binding CsgD family transcriptional regulator